MRAVHLFLALKVLLHLCLVLHRLLLGTFNGQPYFLNIPDFFLHIGLAVFKTSKQRFHLLLQTVRLLFQS